MNEDQPQHLLLIPKLRAVHLGRIRDILIRDLYRATCLLSRKHLNTLAWPRPPRHHHRRIKLAILHLILRNSPCHHHPARALMSITIAATIPNVERRLFSLLFDEHDYGEQFHSYTRTSEGSSAELFTHPMHGLWRSASHGHGQTPSPRMSLYSDSMDHPELTMNRGGGDLLVDLSNDAGGGRDLISILCSIIARRIVRRS